MTHSGVNHSAPLRTGRHLGRRRPEMSTAVYAGVSYVPLAPRSPLLIIDRQLFRQRSPVRPGFYGNITHSVVVAVAYTYISMRRGSGDAYWG